MFDVLGEINWWAVIIGFTAVSVLGGVWFAVLFAEPYNVSLGRAPDAPPVQKPLFFAGPALCTLAMTITTAVLIYALGVHTYRDALLFAVIAGIGYLAAAATNIAINPNFPRPLLYAAITGTYYLLSMVVVALVIVALE